MRVHAIDPGYDRLGVAIVEKRSGKEEVVFSTCVETKKTASLGERLFAIGNAVEELIEEYTPTAVAIETLFFNKNQTTAIGVAQARGIIIYLAHLHKCTVYEFGPQEVKVAVTGYGNSDKKAVFDMVKRLIPSVRTGALDDEYDAIAVGITCLAHHRNTQ